MATTTKLDTSNYVIPEEEAVRRALDEFRDRKFGLMMHFGLYSEMGIMESWPLVDEDASWSRREIETDIEVDEFKRQYYSLNRSFNPLRYRPGEWADTAVRSGFKYVVFTTKHHDGFCLYDSAFSDYKTTSPDCPFSTNPRADIVRTFFDACRDRGLSVVAYYSKADWHHPDYWDNMGVGISTTRNPSYDIVADKERWQCFKDFTRNQLLELVRGYGPLDGLWLDGCWIEGEGPKSLDLIDVIAEARKTTPGLIAIDRWQCTSCENVITPEQCVPESPVEVPWESCITLADNWGYHFDDGYKSVHEIIHLLVDVVAKGGNLALNIGPMPDGRLPAPAVSRLEAIGEWLKGNGEAIYATRVQAPYKAGAWAFTRSKDAKRVFAIRLNGEGDEELRGDLLPAVDGRGLPLRVTHLATGGEIPFSAEGDQVRLAFPEGFRLGPDADAFELRF